MPLAHLAHMPDSGYTPGMNIGRLAVGFVLIGLSVLFLAVVFWVCQEMAKVWNGLAWLLLTCVFLVLFVLVLAIIPDDEQD